MGDNFRGSTSDEEMRSWDPYAHALTVITEPHRMIHDGFMFDASGIVASVAGGASFDVLLRIPAGTFGHLTLVEFTMADTPVDIFFYEGTTTSADGTAANVRNHNRVGATDASSTTVTYGPTVTDVGTELHSRFIPDNGGPGSNPGSQLVSGEDYEWVLGSPSAETTYLWRLTNNSGGAMKIGWHMNGYEIGYES